MHTTFSIVSFGIFYIATTFASWRVQGRPQTITAMDQILTANLRDDKKAPYFEGDIKFVAASERKANARKGSSSDFEAAVSCDSPTGIGCSRLWDGAVVPYTLSRSLRRNKEAVRKIKEAMIEWETKTCIRFVNWTNEEDYVEFDALDG
eukprot:gene16655-18345_t